MSRLVIAIVLTSVFAGCSYGTTAEKLHLTSSPRGAAIIVNTGPLVLRGELIEPQSTGLLLLTASTGHPAQKEPQRLRLVPYSSIVRAEVEQLGGAYAIRNNKAPDADRHERLRLVSRFPHGLPPAVLQKLLASCGQTEVAGVE